MGTPGETLETQLFRDLQDLFGRFGDDELCRDLYRALTNRALQKDGNGRLVLSWNRAAAFVNELRASESHDPLPLAESGGEGVLSETLNEVLDRHGWHSQPLRLS